MKVMLLSYMPLFDHRRLGLLPGAVIDPERIKDMDIPSDVHVEACLWTIDKQHDPIFAPVLVMERAKKVAYHLMEWTEGQPQGWFKIVITDNGSNYCVALFPNIDLSIERWKLGYRLSHDGQEPPKDYQYEVLFQPLAFGAAISDSYRNVKPHLNVSHMEIGLLDMSHINRTKPFDTDHTKIIKLGRFEIAHHDLHKNWSDSFLVDLEPPQGGNWSATNPNIKLEN
jgi:hypothetical protein